jgi:hypothetical protein
VIPLAATKVVPFANAAAFLAGAEYSNGLLHLPVDNGFRGLPKDCAGSFHSAETLNVLWIASKIESYG